MITFAIIAITIGIFLAGFKAGIDYADSKWLNLTKKLNESEWAKIFKNIRD